MLKLICLPSRWTLTCRWVLVCLVFGFAGCGGDEGRQDASVPAQTRQSALATAGAEQPQALSVIALTKVSEVRVDRTTFDYTFQVSIRNDGQGRADILARMTNAGLGTSIIDGEVRVRVLESGATVVSNDTIKLRHNRAYPFNLSALQWNLQSTNAVVIRGIVTDDRVAGATVTVTSLADLSVQAIAVTDQQGAYATPSLAPSQLARGYLLAATGGTTIGKPFAGTLTAVYSLPQDYEQSHVTVLSTALVKAAGTKTQNPTELAAEVLLLGGQAQKAGLYPADFKTLAVAEQYASNASTEIVRWGLPVFTDKIAFEITYPSPASSSATVCTPDGKDQICSAVFPQAGGRLYDQSGIGMGNAIVEVPPVFSGCLTRVNARLSDGGNSLKVWYSILSASESSTCPSSLFTSAMRIALPAGIAAKVPGDCAAESHLAMDQCHTRSAGIAPAYFLNDGPTQRISQGVHETANPAPNTLTLSREYGSNLKSRNITGSHLLSPAVLFVNGYTIGGGFGGDSGTWGRMPELVRDLRLPEGSGASSLIPYNFQWRTNANFLDVAKDFAQAVRYVYAQSGNKPVHIVAHSFGGVLARVGLQGMYSGFSAREWDGVVASVTTLGTPHSGTQDAVGLVEGVLLPDGWVPGPDRPCMQISCYQVGLFAGIPDWAKNSLREGLNLPAPGYIISRLRTGLLNGTKPLPSNAKFQVLIGQFTNSAAFPRRYSNGDRLITYDGQRFLPERGVSREGLLLQARLGTAFVTERVLGLKVGINGTPNTEYALGDGTDYFTNREFAYVHASALVGDIYNPFLNNTIGPAREAEVDSTCIDPLKCSHDSWVNIRELFLSFFGGDPSPNFPGLPEASLFDEFNGTAIDTTKWTPVLHPSYAGTGATVSGGELRLAVGAWLHTQGKATFTGRKIVIDGVMGDTEASILLIDSFNPVTGQSAGTILGSDTLYRGWGFDVQAGGRYPIVGPTTAGSITVAEGQNVLVSWSRNAAMLYRRLTVDGDVVTFERGTSADSITERLSTRMAASISGRTMTLVLGTGVGPYTPGRYQWIRVTVTP